MKNVYYSYDVAKVINVVLFIIHSFGNRIHLLLLNKILYHADLMHLERYGYLITRDKYMLMKNGLVPVNTYFLYTQLIEDNNWVKLKYNIKEYFFIKGNFIYCHQSYNSDVLSNAEVGCLFEVIREYKNDSKAFLHKSLMSSVSRNVSLFNEISILDMAKTIPVSDSMVQYIHGNIETELFKDSFDTSIQPDKKKQVSFLSAVTIGSVFKEHYSQCAYIIVGMSVLQYLVVKSIHDTHIHIDDFIEDMQRSFLVPDAQYTFIPNGSIIDCSQLITIGYNDLYQILINNSGSIAGEISRHDMDNIFQTLQLSNTIPKDLKEEFFVY